MAFTVTHAMGWMGEPDDFSGFPALLDELDTVADAEHPDVSITHESQWSLGIMMGGRVIWENVEGAGDPKHLDGLSREEILRLMRLVAAGDLDSVHSQPWLPGYGPDRRP